MSQTVRRQLIEISNTLRDANDLLGKLFQGVADEEMIELLTDCQNCAITMGNKIEAVYGSGLKSIHALENYCESIYQISQHLDSLSECMEFYEHTKEQLLEVQRDIEEISDKKEIVFMPYKASMWDSLESVYLAAKEDKNCEAYVVPIPYFDRKADKTLGEMHYEGEEYPANIPITNWEKYNFEERQPDVIYIHNAYDDSNLVTCVHPRFFSGNLKKYTEKLVYIPYFVLEEIDPNDQVKIDAMKHFCFLPGIVNADRVILQSESMRQIYMSEYAKVMEAAGGTIDRKQLEEKFLGTGSPKFDKVMNTKKEDLDIPEEWLRIIKKPDGSWKKIIFYNTSVTALLQYNEKMLDKMRYVFKVFKQHQNEVALLWRPHPLIKTTIESMRPQLWAEYSKIVEQYKEEGWGIYDDSSDVDRAVILCDGYYGDPSSVVQLMQRCGINVLIQDIRNLDYSEENAWMDAIVDDGKNLWFSLGNYNGLFCYNKMQKKTIFKGFFPKEELQTRRLFGNAIKIDEKIYFAPVRAKGIAIYNISTGEFDRIEIDYWVKKELRCFNIVQWKNFIYFISTSFQTLIIELNLCTNELRYFEYELKLIDLNADFLGREVSVYNDSLYLSVLDQPLIVRFDFTSKTFQTYKLPCESGFSTICCNENGVFFLGAKYCIMQWNLEKNITRRYCEFPDDFQVQDKKSATYDCVYSKGFCEKNSVWKYPFFKSVMIDKSIFFLSAVMNMSILFDLSTEKIKKCLICETEKGKYGKNTRLSRLQYLFLNNCGNGIINVFSVRKCKLYEFNIYSQKKECVRMQIQLDNEMIRQLFHVGNRIWGEEQMIVGLPSFIRDILYIGNNKG